MPLAITISMRSRSSWQIIRATNLSTGMPPGNIGIELAKRFAAGGRGVTGHIGLYPARANNLYYNPAAMDLRTQAIHNTDDRVLGTRIRRAQRRPQQRELQCQLATNARRRAGNPNSFALEIHDGRPDSQAAILSYLPRACKLGEATETAEHFCQIDRSVLNRVKLAPS